MSLFGNTEVKNSLVGNIHLLKIINGYSAYELAVKHGFEGTEEEWIKSLKGDKGDPGTLESHTEIDALGNRVINVVEPVSDTDVTNKKYVADNYVNSAVEDISNDFVEKLNIIGFTVSERHVYKQGKIISGSLTLTIAGSEFVVEVDCSEGLFILGKIKKEYVPKPSNFIFRCDLSTFDEPYVIGDIHFNSSTGELGLYYPDKIIAYGFRFAFTYICE